MKKKTLSPDRKSTYNGKSQFACQISLVGGTLDGKRFGVVFPTPKYLVLEMGKELYERQDPDTVVEATYRYTDNWAKYENWRKEQRAITQ